MNCIWRHQAKITILNDCRLDLKSFCMICWLRLWNSFCALQAKVETTNPSVKSSELTIRKPIDVRSLGRVDVIQFISLRYKFEQQIRMTRNMTSPYNKSLQSSNARERSRQEGHSEEDEEETFRNKQKFISSDKEGEDGIIMINKKTSFVSEAQWLFVFISLKAFALRFQLIHP